MRARSNRLQKLTTYVRLGPLNIMRVGLYRLALRSGLHPVLKLRAEVAKGPFLRASQRQDIPPPPNAAWDDALWWFGWYRKDLPDASPDWFNNPFSDLPQSDASRDWWCIPDFGTGDIKGLWELSRFDWVVALATKAAQGDEAALGRLNLWLSDWAQANPPYKGPNWKCGQEASIRVMHLVTAAWVLGQDRTPERGLVDLLTTHLQRIAPTMSYAIGQQNNHGTSEAAALFIGGSFLEDLDPRADEWTRKGRYWLEERAQNLIEPDGSFSQYSVTYHRVMLDSYALAEAWRRHRDLPTFSPKLSERLSAATRWLDAMVDRESGDAPNIGANDGARLIQLTGGDYRDFRPTVQLAAALFEDRDAFGVGPWNALLTWLSVPNGSCVVEPDSSVFSDGGYHVLRAGTALAVLRFPHFRFRPSQADALHVDLWHNGVNLLRDAGTYSYNADGAEWYASTEAHNTIVFDGRDQMPRLGKFLFGDWINADVVEPLQHRNQEVIAAAAYSDTQGARHYRQITLSPNGLACKDTISGAFSSACLRWRLAPGDWRLDGDTVCSDTMALSIETDDGTLLTPTLSVTDESRYYLRRAKSPLVSVTLHQPTTLITKVTF